MSTCQRIQKSAYRDAHCANLTVKMMPLIDYAPLNTVRIHESILIQISE